MSWTSSRPYLKTPRGFRIDDTVTGLVVASGTVANGAQLQMMAAAPDMYEALKAAPLTLHTFRDPQARCSCSQCQFVRAARAALAKVEDKS